MRPVLWEAFAYNTRNPLNQSYLETSAWPDPDPNISGVPNLTQRDSRNRSVEALRIYCQVGECYGQLQAPTCKKTLDQS